MSRSITNSVVLLVGCVALGFATSALASGPGGGGTPYPDHRICKGGSSKGADCTVDVDCPGSKCVLDWVSGKGTTLNTTLTAFFDDEVRDFFWSVDTANQAIVIMMEFKANGERHLLAEAYQNHLDPTTQPQVLGWGGIPYDEFDWAGVDCEDFLFARPDAKMGAAMNTLAGLPATKVPVVFSAKKKTAKWNHSSGSDPFGTAIRCKLKIRFLNEP